MILARTSNCSGQSSPAHGSRRGSQEFLSRQAEDEPGAETWLYLANSQFLWALKPQTSSVLSGVDDEVGLKDGAKDGWCRTLTRRLSGLRLLLLLRGGQRVCVLLLLLGGRQLLLLLCCRH